MSEPQLSLRMGRMISGSKTGPKGHICVWNGNICVKSKGKVWFGDLDLSDDATQKALFEYAHALGEPLYILREHDARFDTAMNPKYENYVAIVSPTNTIKFTKALAVQ